MKPKALTILMLAVALVLLGAVFRQERELRRLRATIAQLTGLPGSQESPAPTAANPLPSDVEELRREVAEIQRLRAEVAQLQREKIDVTALQAKIKTLTREVAALSGNLNRRSGSIDFIDGFYFRPPKTSPVVSQAASRAASSPDEAAKWVATLPSGEEQNQAALAVIEHWSGSDPVAAAAWTTQFEEGPLREQAMSLIARRWGLQDWNATSAWMEQLPTGPSRDAAIGAFVTSADGYDIKLALDWANRMDDPEARANRVENTAQRWLREDNASARAWIANAQLPAGMADRLLSAK